MGDLELLKEYVQHHSEEAFATLVARHIDMVYSVAQRQVANPHHAQEITQAVFVILARKSDTLGKETILAGWLHRTTRLTALRFLRSEIRRVHREQEAYMQTFPNQETEADIWAHVSPLLEEAIDGLREKERNAVVLRFLEGKGLREIGLALGTSEDAAQKLVSRAVEKLRNFFVKRGLKVSAAVLVATLTANSLQAAPASLAGSVTAVAAIKGATITPSSLTLIKGTIKLMAWTKLKTATVVAAGLLIAGGTTTVVIKESQFSEPTYHWKSLSKWLEPTYRYEKQYSQDGSLVSTPITVRSPAIDDAVRHMGRAAIPTLLRMVREKSTHSNVSEMQMRAAYGFITLGPEAEEAIPDLSLLVTNREFVCGAAYSLAGISPKALMPLLNAITNQDERVRAIVADALGSGFRREKTPSLGDDASATIEALIICTRDDDKWVRCNAVGSLGSIAQEPDLVVPVLIEKLHDPDLWCRMCAARALAKFKNEAQSAIPALTEATNDSNEMVRQVAKDALKEIGTASR